MITRWPPRPLWWHARTLSAAAAPLIERTVDQSQSESSTALHNSAEVDALALVTAPVIPAPDFRKPRVPPPSPNVIDVLIDLVQPGDGRKRVEIADIHRAYVATCNAIGFDVAPVETFGAQAKAFAEAAGIRTFASQGKVYWCGVKLVA